MYIANASHSSFVFPFDEAVVAGKSFGVMKMSHTAIEQQKKKKRNFLCNPNHTIMVLHIACDNIPTGASDSVRKCDCTNGITRGMLDISRSFTELCYIAL